MDLSEYIVPHIPGSEIEKLARAEQVALAKSKPAAVPKASKAKKQIKRLTTAHGRECFYCSGDFNPEDLTRDHFIPLSKGGCSHIRNIVLACAPCNTEKGNRWPTDGEIIKFKKLKKGVLL